MKLTVGELRKIMEGLPDEAAILPTWASGYIPGDYEPGVEITDILKYPADEQGPEYLGVAMILFYLNDEDDVDCIEHNAECRECLKVADLNGGICEDCDMEDRV